jgi:branched-chain amino acid transport system permease protein
LISIYLILSLSLNLLVGYTGLLSLSHAAFYGIGAYISALLVVDFQIPFVISLLAAIVCAVLLSFTISIPSLRLRGDYFVLASLGFQIIVFTILYNWIDVTRGPYGITNIPNPRFFGIEVKSVSSFFLMCGLISASSAALLYVITNSPFGRVLKAIREDEVAASALGKNIASFKIRAFAIAAGFAALAGVLFSGYIRYIDPTSFTLMESFFVVSIVIIGGAGNFIGPLIGTILLVVLPELLQFFNIPDTVGPSLRQIIYGALLILIVRFRPQGIAGEYRFE